MSPKKFPFSKENFEWHDISNLLINIWGYNDPSYYDNLCTICKQYEQWCIEMARKKRWPEFKNFDFVISQIRAKNKKNFNFGNVSSADKNCIYCVIHKNF